MKGKPEKHELDMSSNCDISLVKNILLESRLGADSVPHLEEVNHRVTRHACVNTGITCGIVVLAAPAGSAAPAAPAGSAASAASAKSAGSAAQRLSKPSLRSH